MTADQRNCDQRADPDKLTKTQAACLQEIFERTYIPPLNMGGAHRRMRCKLEEAGLIVYGFAGTGRLFSLTVAGKKALEHWQDQRAGKCRVCGCTEDTASGWSRGTRRTLCTNCAP